MGKYRLSRNTAMPNGVVIHEVKYGQATPSSDPTAAFLQQNSFVIVAIVISFSVLLGGLGVVGKMNPPY